MREDYEKNKFVKASENIYKIFVKAEGVVALNSPVMMFAVYGCILAISWIGAKMILYEYFDEPNDAVYGFRYAYNEYCKCRAYL